MNETTTLVNKVQKSGLITIDLLNFYPKETIVEIDLKAFLFQGLILREKEFRELTKNHPWTQYQGKNIALYCSEDAIIPHWAFMLIAKHLNNIVQDIFYGPKTEAEQFFFLKNIEQIDANQYKDKKVILKGCNDERLNAQAFVKMSLKLLPAVNSLMYGEACSSVPIYKKKKITS